MLYVFWMLETIVSGGINDLFGLVVLLYILLFIFGLSYPQGRKVSLSIKKKKKNPGSSTSTGH